MFRGLGAVVLDADQATHDLDEPGSLAFDMIEGEFGPEYIRDGRIDRARLGELVFNNADARQKLNAIMHPLVREWMAARTAEALMHGAIHSRTSGCMRSEEHTSELQSHLNLVCRLLLEKKK